VRDEQQRSDLGGILRAATHAWAGFASAPVLIVVSVDQTRDPEHFVEDGAVAVQNICLAAQSLQLGSSWAGVFGGGTRARRGSVEHSVQRALSLPRTHRVIAVVPIGTAMRSGTSSRRPLAEMVHYDLFRPPPAPSPGPAPVADQDDPSHDLPREDRRRPLTKPGKFG
jgi:nitroreductase